MKKQVVPAVIWFAALLLWSAAHVAVAQAPQPRLRLSPTNEVNLGAIRGYGITNITFQLFNEGDAPLQIDRLVPTCPCISGHLDKSSIATGACAVLTVSLDAAQVHGVFQRGLRINSNDPQRPYLPVTLTGQVMAPFEGMPPALLVFTTTNTDARITNVIHLTANEPGLTIGKPLFSVIGNVGIETTIATNGAPPVSYALTNIFIPLARERANITLEIPVLGNPNYGPMTAYYRIMTGAGLTLIPRNVIVPANVKTFQFRITIRNRGFQFDPGAITWEPHIEGLEISVRAAPRGTDLLVSGQINMAAMQKLLQTETRAISFQYPGYEPSSVTFSVAN